MPFIFLRLILVIFWFSRVTAFDGELAYLPEPGLAVVRVVVTREVALDERGRFGFRNIVRQRVFDTEEGIKEIRNMLPYFSLTMPNPS